MIKGTIVSMKNKLWDFLFAGSFKYAWFSYQGKINRTVYSLNVVVVSLIYAVLFTYIKGDELTYFSWGYLYCLFALMQKKAADINGNSKIYFTCVSLSYVFYHLNIIYVDTIFSVVLSFLMVIFLVLSSFLLVYLMFAKTKITENERKYDIAFYQGVSVLPIFFICLFDVHFFRSLYLFIEKLFN